MLPRRLVLVPLAFTCVLARPLHARCQNSSHVREGRKLNMRCGSAQSKRTVLDPTPIKPKYSKIYTTGSLLGQGGQANARL